MQRLRSIPRRDWAGIVESQGLTYHTTPDGPYWDERAYYQFRREQIDELEKATYALNEMCLSAVEHLLTEDADRLVSRFMISEAFVDLCRRSWDRDEISIYGRFDLSYDGRNPPKLLEYNADTPTSLLEASVIQWHWMKQTQSRADQFNSIHDRLIEAWTRWRNESGVGRERVCFACAADAPEDLMTAAYLRDTAIQAGLATSQLDMTDLGWNQPRRAFVDLAEKPIAACFKLYPWEWLLREPFARHLLETFDTTRWLEPPWKMILSNKAILPVLWEMFPESPYLLSASHERLDGDCVRKPIFGREGQGVMILQAGAFEPAYQPPTEVAGPPIYQAFASLPKFDGNFPLVGSWMVNGYAAGIGIREDSGPITRNRSRFVPHVFQP